MQDNTQPEISREPLNLTEAQRQAVAKAIAASFEGTMSKEQLLKDADLNSG